MAAFVFQVPHDLENFLSTEYSTESKWKLCFEFQPSVELWNTILEKVFGYLSKDGTLELELSGAENVSLVKTELKLCGFRDIVEDCSQGNKRILTARKPNYQVGVSVDLVATNSAHSGGALKNEPKKETVQLWKKLSTAQVDENDLVDENTLVEIDNDVKSLEKSACGVGRKPCANCTCGKAEKLASAVKVAKTSLTETAPSSACGNCYRGDAFRCAGCPYLGLPPFKPGEKVDLSSQLQADI